MENNILKWYPFENGKSILYDIKEIDENKKYDYIIIYGYENYPNMINKIEKNLNINGKLLIIGENETGINNWSKCGTKNANNSLKVEEYSENIKTIKKIKEELKQNDFNNIETFYAFPNYRETELILNENFKINGNQIEKYNQSILEDEIKIFDEIKVLKNIISNGKELMEFFANSYIIEASKENTTNKYKYISFNNCRKQEYQLITIIKEDVVEKIPANQNATKHIENMAKIIEELKQQNIEILDYVENGKLYSKLVKNEKTLDLILAENYMDFDKIQHLLNKLKEILLQNSVKYNECKKNVKIQEKEELLQNLNYLPKAYWDMIPKNCFYINDKFVFFDQEWKKDYLPVEFIIYRSIINSYDLVRRINVEQLLQNLGILQYKECFEKLDKSLRDEIIEEATFNQMYCKKITSIDNLINDKKIALMCLEQEKEDNAKKQQYISALEEDNRKKQQYINRLEEDNIKKQEYIKLLEGNKKKTFWRR